MPTPQRAFTKLRDEGGPNALSGRELGTAVLQPVLEDTGLPLSGFALLASVESGKKGRKASPVFEFSCKEEHKNGYQLNCYLLYLLG